MQLLGEIPNGAYVKVISSVSGKYLCGMYIWYLISK